MKRIERAKQFPQKSLQSQQGLTLISWIFVLIIVAFCGIFAFRVVPMYSENVYVQNALKSLAEPGMKVSEMSDSEIRKKLTNFYAVNNVRSEGPQDIVIERKSNTVTVIIDYESRANLFYNIDIVMRFQNHLDGDQPQLCCKPLADARATKY
jgi:Tfp pilus assembly protein PilX